MMPSWAMTGLSNRALWKWIGPRKHYSSTSTTNQLSSRALSPLLCKPNPFLPLNYTKTPKAIIVGLLLLSNPPMTPYLHPTFHQQNHLQLYNTFLIKIAKFSMIPRHYHHPRAMITTFHSFLELYLPMPDPTTILLNTKLK